MAKEIKPTGDYSLQVIHFAEHKLPVFEESKNLDYISYGKKNDYPNYLLELASRSATHNSILTGKAQYVTGNGMKDFTLVSKEDLYRVALDREIFNGFALQVDFGLIGGKIVSIRHVDYSMCRKDKSETNILYCDWTDRTIVKNKEWKVIPIWGAEANQPKKGTYIIYYVGYRPNLKYYPIPDYIGGIAAIETDIEISNYHLNNIKSGFTAGTFLNFNEGKPTAEKAFEVERKIKSKFTGTDNAGSLVINFSDNPDRKPDIMQLHPNDLDKQFAQLKTDTMQEIFVASKVTSPVLFGVATAGALGQRNEMATAFELFQNTYVEHAQKIFEDLFSKLAGVEVTIERVKPVEDKFSEATLAQILSKDEMRAMAGYAPTEAVISASASNVIDAINSLSPLVANKVLESMTPDEVRSLVNLTAKVSDNVPVQMGVQLSKDHIKILHLLDKQPLLDDAQLSIMANVSIESIKPLIGTLVEYGMVDVNMTSGGEIVRIITDIGKAQVKLYPIAFSSTLTDAIVLKAFEAFGTSNKYFSLLRHKFAELTPEDIKVLEVIKSDKGATDETIAKALNIDVAEVTDLVNNLIDKGLITSEALNETTVERRITKEGRSSIIETEIPIKKIETYYAYNKRYDVSGAEIIPTSREFCKRMVEITDTSKEDFKLYSRKDIDKLSSLLNYDVWANRGGWYTKKGTDESTPFCRHIWEATRIVKK